MITKTNAPAVLLQGLDTIFSDYNNYGTLYKDVYTHHNTKKAFVTEVEMSTLETASQREDGAPAASSTSAQQFITTYVPQYYGQIVQISRGMLLDNQYPEEWLQYGKQMKNSMQEAQNIAAMYIFNNAFNPNSAGADGLPLCSTEHPTQNGTLANTTNVNVQLSERAIEDAITVIKGWTNYTGQKMNLQAVKLLVPNNGMFDACRILKTSMRTQTANREISALYTDRYVPGGYSINPYITNPNTWFLLTDHPQGAKFYEREALEIGDYPEKSAQIYSAYSLARWAFGYTSWRFTYGNRGL